MFQVRSPGEATVRGPIPSAARPISRRHGASGPDGPPTYNLSVYGPNGFLRAFRGSTSGGANLAVVSAYDTFANHPGVTLDIHNRGAAATEVTISNAYGGAPVVHTLEPGRSLAWHWSLEASFGWYDLTIEVASDATFKRQLAGHVETGVDSVSDPALGA